MRIAPRSALKDGGSLEAFQDSIMTLIQRLLLTVTRDEAPKTSVVLEALLVETPRSIEGYLGSMNAYNVCRIVSLRQRRQ